MTSIVKHNPVASRRPNILWIDDKIQEFPLQLANISAAENQIFCTRDVGDFLHLLKNYLIDIAIIDLNLLGLDRGEDLVKHVRTNHKTTDIIIYSNDIPSERDFTKDSQGTVYLSVSASEQALMPGSETRLEIAIKSLLDDRAKPEVLTENREDLKKRLLDHSWQSLVKYSNFSAKRIMPILILLNLAISVSINWDQKLVFLSKILENYTLIGSFALFTIVTVTVFFFAPKEIRKLPSFSSYMSSKLVIYENDHTFATYINNELERLGVKYSEMKAFYRLSSFYQVSNYTHPKLRIAIFGCFWLGILLMATATVLNLLEFIVLVLN